jgi:hypothetical protein
MLKILLLELVARSVAVKVNELVTELAPGFCMLPEITPVLLFNVKPVGNEEPTATEYVTASPESGSEATTVFENAAVAEASAKYTGLPMVPDGVTHVGVAPVSMASTLVDEPDACTT